MEWKNDCGGTYWYATLEDEYGDLDEYEVCYRPDIDLDKPWVSSVNGDEYGRHETARDGIMQLDC